MPPAQEMYFFFGEGKRLGSRQTRPSDPSLWPHLWVVAAHAQVSRPVPARACALRLAPTPRV